MASIKAVENWKLSPTTESDPITARIDAYLKAAQYILVNMDKLIKQVLDVNPIRPYFILYSVFEPDRYKRDRLENFIIQYLGLKENELRTSSNPPEPPDHILRIIRDMMPKHDVPKDVIDKLSSFGPEPLQFEIEPIYITYKLASYEPIKINEWSFESLNQEKINVEEEIKKYDVIHL